MGVGTGVGIGVGAGVAVGFGVDVGTGVAVDTGVGAGVVEAIGVETGEGIAEGAGDGGTEADEFPLLNELRAPVDNRLPWQPANKNAVVTKTPKLFVPLKTLITWSPYF